MNNYTANFKDGNLYIAYTQMGLLPMNVEIDPCDGSEPLRYVPERTCKVVKEIADLDGTPMTDYSCGCCNNEGWNHNYCPNCGARVVDKEN